MSTILVNLKRNWFSPDKRRFRKEHNPHELPVAWRSELPSDAQIVEKNSPEPKVAVENPFPQAGAIDAPGNPSAAAKNEARASKSVRDASVSVAAAVENAIAAKSARKK